MTVTLITRNMRLLYYFKSEYWRQIHTFLKGRVTLLRIELAYAVRITVNACDIRFHARPSEFDRRTVRTVYAVRNMAHARLTNGLLVPNRTVAVANRAYPCNPKPYLNRAMCSLRIQNEGEIVTVVEFVAYILNPPQPFTGALNMTNKLYEQLRFVASL